MTEPTDIPEGEETDLLAAEYVLGTLPLAEREACATRLRRDQGFAAAVARWEERLSGLNDAFDEAPPPDLLPRIEARLFGISTTPAKARVPFWRSWFGGAAAAAALGMAILMFLPAPPPALAPVTTLAAENTDLRYAVGLRDNELHLTRLSGPGAAPGRVHELWLIAGDAAPVSLGLITADSAILPAADLRKGMVLAISLEPTGGSPTGAPTGPVLVTGVVDEI